MGSDFSSAVRLEVPQLVLFCVCVCDPEVSNSVSSFKKYPQNVRLLFYPSYYAVCCMFIITSAHRVCNYMTIKMSSSAKARLIKGFFLFPETQTCNKVQSSFRC